MGRAFRYRYSLHRRFMHVHGCIGDAASMDAYASSRLHRRHCIGDTASARLHWRCWICDAMRCDAMLAFTYAGWAWAINATICDAHATLRLRRCVGDAMLLHWKKYSESSTFFPYLILCRTIEVSNYANFFSLWYANWNKLCLSCTTECAWTPHILLAG